MLWDFEVEGCCSSSEMVMLLDAKFFSKFEDAILGLCLGLVACSTPEPG